jgi:SulP family sulfate permease
LKPKLFSMFINKNEDLNKNQIVQDSIAGVIVAIIAIPLSIALAIASGVSPEKGLITAIIAGFLVSFLGGSRVQVGGPTGAFVVIVYGIVQQYGVEGLSIATIMAGIILVLFGIFRFGSVIKFIPYPITTGFTCGIAVVLCTTQIKDFFGLKTGAVPSDFIDKWGCYFKNFSTINIIAFLVGLASLLIIVLWPKINKTIPGSLIALILVTLTVTLFNLKVETIGSQFGNISSKLPSLKLFNINVQTINALLKPAFTIAILAGIESLLSAVVADGMIGKKHSSNMELIAQGVANIASGLF